MKRLLATALTLVIALILAVYLISVLTKPVRRLLAATADVARGHYHRIEAGPHADTDSTSWSANSGSTPSTSYSIEPDVSSRIRTMGRTSNAGSDWAAAVQIPPDASRANPTARAGRAVRMALSRFISTSRARNRPDEQVGQRAGLGVGRASSRA